VQLLNSGDQARKVVRALGAFERLCSPEELLKQEMKRKAKGTRKRNRGLDFGIPDQVTLEGVRSVARGEYIGGVENAPHKNRTALAETVLAMKEGLPWKQLETGKEAKKAKKPKDDALSGSRHLPMNEFIVALSEKPSLFTIFFGALLDTYHRKENTWQSEHALNADALSGTDGDASPMSGGGIDRSDHEDALGISRASSPM